MMRIVFCVTNDVTSDQRVNRIVHSLQKSEADILLIGIKRPRSVPVNSTFRIRRFNMLFAKGPLFYAEYNIRLFLVLLFTPADVFVANDLDTLAAVFLASRIRRKPLVYDSHEYFTGLPELVDRKHTRWIWEKIESFILPRIKYSYTVNESIASAYNKKYGTSMKVVRNLPFRISRLPSESFLRTGTGKLILYQGALNMGRGLELAISAMRYMKNCRLIIAGTGYLEDELHNMARQLEVEDKVLFTGLIPPADLISYTAQADLGISLEENRGMNYFYALPNKLFDYIQCRIPVLVSDRPEMASVVSTYGVGMICTTTDPRELSDIFYTMLENNELRSGWKANLEKAAVELCWEKEEDKLLNIYSGIFKDHAFSIKDK